jgi:hypothetical protein
MLGAMVHACVAMLPPTAAYTDTSIRECRREASQLTVTILEGQLFKTSMTLADQPVVDIP